MSDNNKQQSTSTMQGPRQMGGGMGTAVAKPKDFKKTMASLLAYARAFLPWIILAWAMTGTGAVLQIIGPKFAQQMTDTIMEGVDPSKSGIINMDEVFRIGITLTIFYSTMFVLYFLTDFTMASVTQKIAGKMRSDISTKINRLPFSYFHKHSYGDILSRITNDVDTVGQTLNQSAAMMVRATAMLTGSVIMMFVTNWILAFVAIGAIVLGFLGMIAIMKKSQKYFVANARQLGAINGHIEEAYTGHTVIKAYNANKLSKASFEKINTKLNESGWKSQFFSGLMQPLMGFVGNFGYVAVCVVGAVLVKNGKIEFGVIVAFMIYVRLFNFPLTQLAQVIQNLQRAAASSERVFTFLGETELEDESNKLAKLEDTKGAVEFVNVKFGYNQDKTVINNFSAKVDAGQKIAIVGPTGAGKTTMVNLLMRFYEINDGQILIDGMPTNQVKREDIHDKFDMVLQDTWMFEGTIKENIVYSKPNVSDEEVINACKTVGLHHFINTLSDGYNTVLNDRASLSEGQKQLLTIARAIIKNSPLLILDEATSSVDTRTERIVQEAMDKLTTGRTSFVIAHRLSTIKNADMILVMKDGDIIESGNHDDLLAKGGFYAELYNSQFDEGESE